MELDTANIIIKTSTLKRPNPNVIFCSLLELFLRPFSEKVIGCKTADIDMMNLISLEINLCSIQYITSHVIHG